LYPFFYDGLTQRTRDVDKAKALLQQAGVQTPLKATLHFGDLQEIPQLAQIIQVGAKDGGFDLQLAGESLDTFYGAQWCPKDPADPPCSGAAELGIVDYGHRATPDVYLNAALKSKGIWNSSQYASSAFDTAFSDFQKAVGVAIEEFHAGPAHENDEVSGAVERHRSAQVLLHQSQRQVGSM
jgi:peptide/nickel transport system substrate-binding protein